jgi:exonuclease III
VAGIRREGTRMGGPKIGAVRALVNKHTDFTILTETKCAEQNIQKLRLRYGMKLTLTTNYGPASSGVAIYSKRGHKLVEGSARHSEPDGHYICGVYDVLGKRIVVAGVYGVPDNNDNSSALVYEHLNEHIQELKILFNTGLVLAAGDFNCGINENDFSTQNYKPRTTAKLLHLIDENDLIDLGALNQNFGHTYYRRGDSRVHSRIDLILTNINCQYTRYYRQPTIFDHLSIVGILGKIEKNNNPPTMKDYILSSEKFMEGAEIIINSIANEVGIPVIAFQKHNNEHEQLPMNITLPLQAEQESICELNQMLTNRETTSLHTKLFKDCKTYTMISFWNQKSAIINK